MGGEHTTQFKREYLCEIIKDETNSTIPEFNELLEQEIVKEWPKPPFSDFYVSMDLGGVDLTAVLFAYYDFRADKVIIEDELIMDFNKPDSSISKLANGILEKENFLFTDPITFEKRNPHMRVSDINYIVTQEIHKYSGNQLSFSIPRKDDKIAAVNDLRALLSSKKIIIHPKCKTLIRHLKNVKWNKDKTKFIRSPDEGHYDAVDACLYLIRSISYGRNPYPSGYGMDLRNMHVGQGNNLRNKQSQAANVFQTIMDKQKTSPQIKWEQIFGSVPKKVK